MSTTSTIKVKPYKTKELAAIYGVSIKTLRTWLNTHQEVIGNKAGHYYTAQQIRTIFSCLGEP